MHQADENQIFAQKLPLISLLVIGSLGTSEPSASEIPLPPPPQTESKCGPGGVLNASLFGSIETNLNWSSRDMKCESMQRPNGEGIRFRFAGDAAGERLAIIIAVPGLKPDEVDVELPSKVTVTVEGSGRFFTTPNLESCWTEIQSQTSLPDQRSVSAINGVLYCIAPLGEVNADAAVSIPELSFSALVQWGDR